MHYTALELKNFRSYSTLSVELAPTVNIVVGPNATGKTNLLEAVMVVSRGGSFRGRDKDLISFNKPWARIDVFGTKHNRRLKILAGESRATKEFVIDGVTRKRLGFEQTVPVTLFEPEHLRMIHGSPERRRDYLDSTLEQIKPGYKDLQSRYKRALAQRNQLLKQPNPSRDQLFVWDVRLSEYGAAIVAERTRLIKDINDVAGDIYGYLSGQPAKVELVYNRSVTGKDYTSAMLKQLEQQAGRDQARGYTSVGPHREDVTFYLNKQPAAQTASRGELRSLVIMCKLIELQAVEDTRGVKPILLLDDVFSELDSARRRALIKHLKDYQTIITTTDADAVVKHFMGGYNVIPTQARAA